MRTSREWVLRNQFFETGIKLNAKNAFLLLNRASNAKQGVFIDGVAGASNNVVANTSISDAFYGILVVRSSNNWLPANKISSVEIGVELRESSQNHAYATTVSKFKRFGIEVQGGSDELIEESNIEGSNTNSVFTASGIPLAGIMVDHGVNVRINSNRVNSTHGAIYLTGYTNDSLVENNYVWENEIGLFITGKSKDNEFNSNNVFDNRDGIRVSDLY